MPEVRKLGGKAGGFNPSQENPNDVKVPTLPFILPLEILCDQSAWWLHDKGWQICGSGGLHAAIHHL